MKAHWLERADRPRVLLFFNGFGLDPRPFLHLSGRDHDVLCLYDYRDLIWPPALLALLGDARPIDLAAYSLGVWVADRLRDLPALLTRVELQVAINGTPHPLDARFGIPPERFRSTAKTYSAANQEVFYQQLFSDPLHLARFRANLPQRTWEDQRAELEHLATQVASAPSLPDLRWNQALVGRQDQIFPAANQLRWWKGRALIQRLEAGHFPFLAWETWEEVLHAAA